MSDVSKNEGDIAIVETYNVSPVCSEKLFTVENRKVAFPRPGRWTPGCLAAVLRIDAADPAGDETASVGYACGRVKVAGLVKEAYAELGDSPVTTLLTCTDVVYDLVLKEFCISLKDHILASV